MDPATLATIVAFLASSGLLSTIVIWFWKLGPRLALIENELIDIKKRLDSDHGPQIDQNRRDIADVKGTVGVIDERTRGTQTTLERMWAYVQEKL